MPLSRNKNRIVSDITNLILGSLVGLESLGAPVDAGNQGCPPAGLGINKIRDAPDIRPAGYSGLF
jgi:hypothetical protein